MPEVHDIFHIGHTLCENCYNTGGKEFFAIIQLSVAKNVFVWKTFQLDTASTTNILAVNDLWNVCPAGFDVISLIPPSRATHLWKKYYHTTGAS